MTADKFLEQYGDTVAKIKRKQRLKESLEAQMLNVTSHLTPDKVQSSGSMQKVAEAVEEALDLAEEIKELLILKNKIRKDIESVINRILTLRGDALYEKYLVLTSEEDIAKVIDRTVDTVHRLIREGKEEVQQILDTEYCEITENNAK